MRSAGEVLGVRPVPGAAGHQRTRDLFLRLLGVVFFVAFLSLRRQLLGLLGAHGIAPAAGLLANARLAHTSFWQLPTVFWLSASDGALRAGAAVGLGLSLALVVGLAPRYVLLALWALYLSFVSVGDLFFGYQWDILLIETAFFSAWFAPGGWSLGRGAGEPSSLALFLMRWLLFRLMWMSGVVKLASGDSTWRDLSALSFHFWTQPLPTVVGWYVAHLPDAVLRGLCSVTLGIELILPFFIFGTRRLREVAFFGFLLLQLSIAVTGNYGFFNLLTCVLCVPLLDDRGRPRRPGLESGLQRPALRVVATVALALVSALPSLWRLLPGRVPGALPVLRALAPFATFNTYGLFAVMTTERDEIVVEGSDDGQAWLRYEFPWKPSSVDTVPGWVAPMQPRVDWQMWFASLGSCNENAWFLSLSERLLAGEDTVLKLMAKVPFQDHPPRYLRSTRWKFQPETWAAWRRTGHYWRGEAGPSYCPALTLVDGHLAAVR